MEKQLVDRYINIQTDLQQKKSEFEKSIEHLEQELFNRRKAFDESVKDLIEEKALSQKTLLKLGEDILKKIDKLAESKYHWCYPDEAVSEFGIVRLSASDEDSYETVLDETDNPNFALAYCKLTYIDEINDTHIKFSAEEVTGHEFLAGYIKIPIKYFTTDCLDDEAYIKSVYDKIDIKLGEREEAARVDLIAKLEAKLAKLKGEK